MTVGLAETVYLSVGIFSPFTSKKTHLTKLGYLLMI